MYCWRLGRRFDLLAIDQEEKKQGVTKCERAHETGRGGESSEIRIRNLDPESSHHKHVCAQCGSQI